MLKNVDFVFAPSHRALKSSFTYVPEMGRLCRTVYRNGVPALTVTGYPTTSGRLQVRINNVVHRAEALIWAFHNKEWTSPCPEHVNGDVGDNRIENLYLAEGTTTQPLMA